MAEVIDIHPISCWPDGYLTNKTYTRASKMVPKSLLYHSLLNLIPHFISFLHYLYVQIQNPLPLALPNQCLYHCHWSALISPAKRTICNYYLMTLLDKFLLALPCIFAYIHVRIDLRTQNVVGRVSLAHCQTDVLVS